MSEVPVTVLMPVYNAEPFLEEAIKSILGQTLNDFEFLIINDGSTDRTKEIIESFDDSRINALHIDNIGLSAVLEVGMNLARGEYIARMDGDDISLPRRLEIQKQILDQNPDFVLVHCLVDFINEEGKTINNSPRENYTNIETKWILLWKNIIVHPSVMMRAKPLRENSINYRRGIDEVVELELWNELSLLGNYFLVPEVFLKYRIHKKSYTWVSDMDRRLRSYSNLLIRNFARYNIVVSEQIATELAISSGQTWSNPLVYPYRYINRTIENIMRALSERFAVKHAISEKELSRIKALQLLRFSRYLIQQDRSQAFKLLYQSISFYNKILITHLFWKIVLCLCLPSSIVLLINKKRSKELI